MRGTAKVLRQIAGPGCLAAGLLLLAGAQAAAADIQPAGAHVSLDYQFDLVSPVGGRSDHLRRLDNLDLSGDIVLPPMSRLGQISGHAELSLTGGRSPGADLGVAQGLDAIEVSAHRLRLYQMWLEAASPDGRTNLRIGLSDLSAEFAALDSAGLLLNPSFGMAPDLAATGAAAYPSTALGVRLRADLTDEAYVQAAVVNAAAGVPGDRGGVDLGFHDGAFAIIEAGWTGAGKLAVGYWRRTQAQDDLERLDPTGAPRRRTSQGAYLAAETVLRPGDDGHATLTGFLRAGISEGRTTPFAGSVQAGLLAQPVLASRPESAFAIGVTQAFLSPAYRNAAASAGPRPDRADTVVEVSYSDQLTEHLRLQPALELVRAAEPGALGRTAVVGLLRVNVGF